MGLKPRPEPACTCAFQTLPDGTHQDYIFFFHLQRQRGLGSHDPFSPHSPGLEAVHSSFKMLFTRPSDGTGRAAIK